MDDASAWLVPTHPPKFDHTAALLRSVREHGVSGTWVPVFTTSSEAHAFYSEHQVDPDGVHLVVEPVVGPVRVATALANRSIVNLKKIAALWDLRHDFPVFHVIDAECRAFRPGSATASTALRSRRRAWPAHEHAHPGIREIQRATVDVFDVRDRGRLRSEVLTDRHLYSWFEDVPTYHRDDLSAFFEYFGATDDVTVLTDALTWGSFDHLLYQYFCCLHRGWVLEDTGLPSPSEGSAWWELWRPGVPAHREDGARHLRRWAPSWVRDEGFAHLSPNAFLLYHLDRT